MTATTETSPPQAKPRKTRTLLIAIVTAAALVVAGGVVVAVKLLGGPSEADIAAAEAKWGLSPDPHAGADFQPDVVVLEHGALAIEQPVGDGFGWELKEKYPGVDRIKEGDVLFLTNHVVGRVGAVEHPKAGGVVVVLVPVDLPEVLRKADLEFSEDVNDKDFVVESGEPYPGAMTATYLKDTPAETSGDDVTQQAQEGAADSGVGEGADASDGSSAGSAAPGGGSDGSGKTEASGAAFIKPVAKTPGPSATPTPPSSADPQDKGLFSDPGWKIEGKRVAMAPWTIGVTASNKSFGVKAYVQDGGLQGVFKAEITYDHLHMEGAAHLADGKWEGKPTVVLQGLTGFSLAYGAGVNTLEDNANYLFEVPLKFSKSVVLASIPMAFTAEFKLQFKTGLSVNHDVMLAQGKYSMVGDLGMRDGQPVTPKVFTVNPMIESISVASIGIDSAIFGFNVKIGIGLGISAVNVGPYSTFTATAGVLRGTSLTGPWGVPCQVTLVLNAGGGIGAKLSTKYLDALKRRLKLRAAPDLNVNVLTVTKEIANRTLNMPICPLGSPIEEAPRETPPVQKTQENNDPYTAAGSPNVPGRNSSPGTRSDKPSTKAVENPESPNPDLGEDGAPKGEEPKPRSADDDDYSLEYDYCDLQPDPRHSETDIYGNPKTYYCADFEPPISDDEKDPPAPSVGEGGML